MQDCRRYTAMNIQLTDGRQHVFQWETGRYIKLVDVASCPIVNFFDPKSDEAYTVQTKTVDGVIQAMIPNELLQLDSKIKLYCVGIDSNGDFIQIHAVIPLIPRQRPTNYVYEPSDIMTFESVLAEAKGYRDDAASSANEAKTSETNAKNSETNAKTSETNAKTSENNAKTSETNAADSASDAFESKNAAKASQDAAKESEDNASASEQSALTSKDAAKTSEDNAKASELAAKDSEDAAKASEDAAEASKSAAENAAETATQKATEASSDADTASAKAEDAADSAANALADRKLAERYAKGTEDGTPVSSGTGYQDNAKYYKEQAESIVTGLENEIELGNKFFLDDEGYLDQI